MNIQGTDSFFKRKTLLFSLLLLKAIILLFLVTQYEIHLAPDEAQYWTWSQQLDWGYYSKPPGIAWQIALTTALFGNTELGVRIGAILICFFLALAVYQLALASRLSPKEAFWAALVMAFSPLGMYLSMASTTDVGAILFFTLGAVTIAKGIDHGPNYLLTGFWILCGALYKWVAFIFWPFVLIALLFYPALRRWSLLGGIAISLLAFVPTLYWNSLHDFATFKHVASTVGGGQKGNFFDFLAAQIGLLSPIFFILLILGLIFVIKEGKSRLYFCAFFPAAVAIYLLAALSKKMQPNWAAYLYPPGMVLIAWFGMRRHIWLYLGLILSIFLVALAVAIPWMQVHSISAIPYRVNPFRQSLGWNKLEHILNKEGYRSERDFLFSDKYQGASLLSFYSPRQKRAYFFNLGQARKNQFSYWPQMEEKEVGNDGYFFVFENTKASSLPWYETHYLEKLSPYFEHVEFKGAEPLFTANGVPVKYALIFKGINYNGKSPAVTEKY